MACRPSRAATRDCASAADPPIEEACGERVTLVEHRSGLTYWTARVREG
ncbi:hypothetical protein Jiend_24810 [Micromonospora endophytica]|nr:hypothetical protein Jiend_24810 [Micromonospora endophytica]